VRDLCIGAFPPAGLTAWRYLVAAPSCRASGPLDGRPESGVSQSILWLDAFGLDVRIAILRPVTHSPVPFGSARARARALERLNTGLFIEHDSTTSPEMISLASHGLAGVPE
jgi:hypothetical protein